MASLSKMASDRLLILDNLLEAIDSRGAEVAEKMGVRMFPSDDAASVEKRKSYAVALEGLVANIQRVIASVGAADDHVMTEKDDDDAPRKELVNAKAAARQQIMKTRKLIGGSFGDAALKRIGLQGATPTRAIDVKRLAEHCAERLRAGDAGELSDPTLATVNLDAVATALETKAVALDVAMKTVQKEGRELDKAFEDRDEAVLFYRRTYGNTAATFENWCRLCDLDKLADRIRPTAKRRSGKPEPEDLERRK